MAKRAKRKTRERGVQGARRAVRVRVRGLTPT